ncbi:glucocorticoid modulatory element-binding protein 1 isoform X1 [Eucyclogobius newberryi]|uniref:glucocorticoid modulatory element-binding protein 1 isoform X1 n=1 Tax=Eucyclogobius newberryi TaxID=166745 RepID=UPI003B5AD67C
MASPEITVPSVEDMVMVKMEDSDPNKTQVILQLQQITGDESSEASAAVMAVEAAPEQSDEEVEIGCPITCGDCKAVLILKKFVCPGINVKCVKFGDQLISPKQFVHLSGKATLKDWKRAIRMNGVMLRKMMDSGQLDFFEHTTLCTNTCRSTKFDLLINNTRFPPDGTGLTTPTSAQGQAILGNGGTGGDVQTESLSAKMEWISGDNTEKSSEISDDTLNFWKGIADVGLLGEVVTNINTELLALLNGVQQRSEPGVLQDTDSCLVEVAVLSNLAQVFGLLDTVKKLLERRRGQTDPSQEDELRLLSNLEIQLEEQKKQQQVRALLSCPQPPKIKTPTKRPTKRPRLTRPASATTLQATTLQPQQFTVLSPISLTSMGQPLTMAGLPIASLAQSPNTVTLLPAGSQFFTRYMVTGSDGKTDTITLHPSSGLTLDSSQLGTMMNPVELVQLSQQSGSTEMVPLDGQVVMQQDDNMQDQALGVMELQLTGDASKDNMMVQSGMEVTMATEEEESQCQTQEGQSDTTQGLQLDANGQLQSVQIVVLEN